MPPDHFSSAALDVPYLRILLVLGMTLLVSLAAAWVLRRFTNGANPKSGGDRVLELKDSLSLGPRRRVLALEANGRTILLASTQDRITFLSDLGPAVGEPPAITTAREPTPLATPLPSAPSAEPDDAAPEGSQPAFARVLEAARQFQAADWARAV